MTPGLQQGLQKLSAAKTSRSPPARRYRNKPLASPISNTGKRHGRLERATISQIRGRAHAPAARPARASAAAQAPPCGRSRLWAGQFHRAPGRALSTFGGDWARFLARYAAQGARTAAELQIRAGRYCNLDARPAHRPDLRQCRHAMAARSSGDYAPFAEGVAGRRRAGHSNARQYPRARAHVPARSRRERTMAGSSGDQSGAARRSAVARSLLRSAQAGLQRDRHLAHRLPSRDGLAGSHHRMVQGLVIAAVPLAARRRHARTVPRGLYGKNRRRLQTALRRQGALTLSAAFHYRYAVIRINPPPA